MHQRRAPREREDGDDKCGDCREGNRARMCHPVRNCRLTGRDIGSGRDDGTESAAARAGATSARFVAFVVADGGVDTFGSSGGAAAFSLRRFGRDCFVFFRAAVVRVDFFPSTSAETSSVQRTRRPVSGRRNPDGVLRHGDSTRIALAAICVPASFRARRPDRGGGRLQDGQAAFKLVSRLSHFGSALHWP